MDWNNINPKYAELLRLVCQNCEVSVEQSLDSKENTKDKKQTKKIMDMRDDMSALRDKIAHREELTKQDWLKIYICALTSKTIIQKNIKTWEQVIKAYDEDLLPKLKNVIEAKATDESITANFGKLPE